MSNNGYTPIIWGVIPRESCDKDKHRITLDHNELLDLAQEVMACPALVAALDAKIVTQLQQGVQAGPPQQGEPSALSYALYKVRGAEMNLTGGTINGVVVVKPDKLSSSKPAELKPDSNGSISFGPEGLVTLVTEERVRMAFQKMERYPGEVQEVLKTFQGKLQRGKLTQEMAEMAIDLATFGLRINSQVRKHQEAIEKIGQQAAERTERLNALTIQAFQQINWLEDTYPDGKGVREHIQHLYTCFGRAEILEDALVQGKKLAYQLTGKSLKDQVESTAPADPEPAAPTKEQPLTNIADAKYLRDRLGHMEAPQRKGKKKAAARKSG